MFLEVSESAIGTLFNGITSVITNMMSLFGKVSTELLANPIYIIVIGLAILSILIGYGFVMANKIKKRRK